MITKGPILVGCLVQHLVRPVKGVVSSINDGLAKVISETGEAYRFPVEDLEWQKPEAKDASNPKDAIATNKLPNHLVSPIVKAYQAISHFLGNVKYGAWNFRAAGARASVYRAALDRHVDAWWEGEECDPVDGTPHLANALACLNIIIEAKHAGKLIDDRPPSLGGELAKVRAEFEALMPKIREKYADKSPRHYTIADSSAMAESVEGK